MNKLSVKQKQTLEAIEYFINKCGYSPTINELCVILNNKSKSTVFDKLIKLEEKGYISTINGRARTIKVLRSDND